MILALLLLGSQYLSTTDTTVYLDTPPPGATQLVVRVRDWNANLIAWGYENLDAGQSYDTSCNRLTQGFSLNDGSTSLVQDRAYSYLGGTLSAYDGTTDYAGTSGMTVSDYHTKTTGWETYTYSTAPTTLSFVRRWQHTGCGAYFSNYYNSQIDGTCEWYWQ